MVSYILSILHILLCIIYYYSAPDRRAEYCDERVCLSVYLSVRDHIFGTTRPIFTKFFVHVIRGRGSVLLWLLSSSSSEKNRIHYTYHYFIAALKRSQ